VNLEALPYAVIIILAEFSVGSLAATLFAHWRGMVAPSFVKLSATVVVIGAALALLSATGVDATNEVEGYRLQESLFTSVRVALAVFLAISVVVAWSVFREQRAPSLATGVVATVAGLIALGLLAKMVSAPAWGLAGVLLSLLAGAAALGLVSEAMILGHWYLVSPRLPNRPLQELTLLLFVALLVQAALVVLNAAVPARDVPETSAALGGGLATNPAVWLRVGVGLVFPTALAYMAWQSSNERAMMSATGLLYIAVGAVFAGEILARGLLFVTAAPV